MPNTILQTKLHPPHRPQPPLHRAALIDRLNAGRAGRLTLVSAPAGFGKTTLVADWIDQLNNPGQIKNIPDPRPAHVAWLSLEPADSDPYRFLAYLLAAVQKVLPETVEAAVHLLQAPQPPPPAAVLTAWLNELATLGAPLIIVLDDYHHVDHPPVHETTAFILDHAPPTLHLVITTRSDPPLPLGRLRARGELSEIRQADLTFSEAEAAAFLADQMELTLLKSQVQSLTARTEGWIAGLQLAALSLAGRQPAAAASFIDAFSGSHRYIMDYLMDEVMTRLDPDTRRFLQHTAILSRLSAGLCQAVTGRSDCRALLARLEQANLFIVPLDEERRWYRTYHLFGDLLRQRLAEEEPAAAAPLHRRAAAWYQAEGLPSEAINHYLAAGDHQAAADLVEAEALAVLNRGGLTTVGRWLDALPADSVSGRPWLAIFRGWVDLLTGRLATLDQTLDEAQRAAADDHARGHIAAIRAYVSLMKGEVPAASTLAQKALTRLPADDGSTRSVVTFILGGASLFQDDIAGARLALNEAGTRGLAAGNIHLACPALSTLGTIEMACGQLQQARETFDRARQAATTGSGRLLPVAAGALNGRGLLHYEWNDLAAAEADLQKAVELGQAWGNIEALIGSFVDLAQIYMALGQPDEAAAALQQAIDLAAGKALSPQTPTLLAAGQIRCSLARGDLAHAALVAREAGLSGAEPPTFLNEVGHLAVVRLRLAQQRLEPALRLLIQLQEAAEAGGRTGRLIEILALQAAANLVRGSGEIAQAVLQRALTLAEPEGHVRTLIDVGPALRPLLQQAADGGPTADYAAALLAAEPGWPAPTLGFDGGQVEPLTDHELAVLHLVAAGRTNKEAAAELIVSVNTVKYHLKQIYAKLGVHGRVDALSRARELGLL